MAYRKLSEVVASKGRGRPRKIANIEQSSEIELKPHEEDFLDNSSITQEKLNCANTEAENEYKSPLHELPNLIKKLCDDQWRNPPKIISAENKGSVESDVIDSIDFKNGENTLSIKFIQNYNRTYRIQMFLNDKIEIRNVTYSGNNTANNFWSLLKGNLK